MGVCALFIVPVGVATAIYLEEYADNSRWWNRLIEVNIQNLAAVPSIVYGILGLAFLVRGPLSLGPVVLAGGLTLGLLVLPVVIIAAREAIRAVPPSIREGSLALGATQWQTIWKQVLPAAIPGIATGVILALSRAIGETAPLIVVGRGHLHRLQPGGPRLDASPRMPIQIFDWISRASNDVNNYRPLAAAAILLLMIMLLLDEQRGHLAAKPLRAEVVGDRNMAEPVTEPQDKQRGDRARPEAAARASAPGRRGRAPAVAGAPQAAARAREAIFGLEDVQVSYGAKPAVRGVSFDIGKNEITALIGPSGCGKSTLIRCLNRMNDLIPGARVEGKVLYHGQDLYAPEVDAVEVRKRIGMVFQKPNPFPKSIYDNIAFGPRVLGMKGDMDEIVERALTQGGALGRGQGPPEDQRLRHVRRPAAAALHRALPGGQPRRDPDGRALLGARPDLHRARSRT